MVLIILTQPFFHHELCNVRTTSTGTSVDNQHIQELIIHPTLVVVHNHVLQLLNLVGLLHDHRFTAGQEVQKIITIHQSHHPALHFIPEQFSHHNNGIVYLRGRVVGYDVLLTSRVLKLREKGLRVSNDGTPLHQGILRTIFIKNVIILSFRPERIHLESVLNCGLRHQRSSGLTVQKRMQAKLTANVGHKVIRVAHKHLLKANLISIKKFAVDSLSGT